jgi:hypothetical protein
MIFTISVFLFWLTKNYQMYKVVSSKKLPLYFVENWGPAFYFTDVSPDCATPGKVDVGYRCIKAQPSRIPFMLSLKDRLLQSLFLSGTPRTHPFILRQVVVPEYPAALAAFIAPQLAV